MRKKIPPHHHHTQLLQALERCRYVSGIGRIEPDVYYHITTYCGIPALQQDPRGLYFGMFGVEILCIIDRHNK